MNVIVIIRQLSGCKTQVSAVIKIDPDNDNSPYNIFDKYVKDFCQEFPEFYNAQWDYKVFEESNGLYRSTP